MQLTAVMTTGACICLLFHVCDAASRKFILAGQDRQYKTFGIVRQLKVMSLTHCAVLCLNMGSQCGSFSFSHTKLCTINAMRIQTQHVQQSHQLFEAENGTLVYGSESGVVMPHGNAEVRDTASYSYLLSLNKASWYDAFELCQQFGEGFYLANIEDLDELDSLYPWLMAVAKDHIWVSGTDENHEACWVWAAPVITMIDHTMFWGNQPDNGFGMEHCLVMNKDSNLRFSDVPCSYNHKYLCKRAATGASFYFPTTEQARSTNIC